MRVGRYGPYIEEVVPAGIDPKTGEITDAAALVRMAHPPRRAAPPSTTTSPGRADARDGPRAARDRGRRRPGARPGPGHRTRHPRQGWAPLRPLRHRGAARGGSGSGGDQDAGKAVKAKPRTASLFKDMDLATIDLATALKLLSLPRVVGADLESGAEITAQNGALRAVPEEGHRLPLARDRAAVVRHHPRAGARDLRPAQAAWPDRGQAAAGRAGA